MFVLLVCLALFWVPLVLLSGGLCLFCLCSCVPRSIRNCDLYASFFKTMNCDLYAVIQGRKMLKVAKNVLQIPYFKFKLTLSSLTNL